MSSRRTPSVAVAVAFLLALAGAARAQAPVNDDCAGALPVGLGLTAFDSTSATDGAGLPLDPLVCDMGSFGDEQIYKDVWFSFSPAVTASYDVASVNNGNPTFDSRLAIYDQATCPDVPANVVACDDDSGPGLEAEVLGVPLNAGATYLIRIGSFSPTSGEQPAALSIALGALPPVNDDCANATAISGFGTFAFDNTAATTDGSDLATFCDPGAFGDDDVHGDVWFSYTATTSGCTYVSTLGLAPFDTRIAIYGSTTCPDDPATVVGCVDDEILPTQAPFEAGLDVVLQAGTTYLIRIGNFAAADPGGAGSFQVAAGPVAQNAIGAGETQPGWTLCPAGPVFTDHCNGDGGDQMGCTACPCGNEAPPGTIGGCVNGAFDSARLEVSGDPSVSLPAGSMLDLRLSVTGARAGGLCVLTSGGALAPTSPSHPCFGAGSGAQRAGSDGLACFGAPLVRHGNRVADGSGAVGGSAAPWGGEGPPASGLAGAAGFAAGQTRMFQVLYREDPLAVCARGSNSSQAVEVLLEP